jgi:hypothetical protein
MKKREIDGEGDKHRKIESKINKQRCKETKKRR